MIRSSSTKGKPALASSKPSIKISQQPLPKLPLPKKPSNKPTRVGLKTSTAQQSTQAESALTLTKQASASIVEPINSFRPEIPQPTVESARTAFVTHQIALVTFAETL